MTLNIDSKQQIAGFPAVRIRSLLRSMGPDAVATPCVAETLAIRRRKATSLMAELERSGYVARLRPELLMDLPLAAGMHAAGWYRTTVLGRFFAQMSLAPRLKQATAEKAVADFLKRLKDVNADDNFAYRIVAAVAFGGFPSAPEDRVSVRIAVELELRNPAILREMLGAKFNKLLATGNVSGFLDSASYPRAGIWQFLRNGKRTVDLHHLLTLERLAREVPLEYRILFGDRSAIRKRLGSLGKEV